jgi:hypothetical protein
MTAAHPLAKSGREGWGTRASVLFAQVSKPARPGAPASPSSMCHPERGIALLAIRSRQLENIRPVTAPCVECFCSYRDPSTPFGWRLTSLRMTPFRWPKCSRTFRQAQGGFGAPALPIPGNRKAATIARDGLSHCVDAGLKPSLVTWFPEECDGWAECYPIRRAAASGDPTWRPGWASRPPSSSAVRSFHPACNRNR